MPAIGVLTRTMELTVRFFSQTEWNDWHQQNCDSFNHWRELVLHDVIEFGYREPILGTEVGSSEFTIGKELRESIAHQRINSRKRAMLLEIDTLSREGPPLSRSNTRIFAPEARSRIAQHFAKHFAGFEGSEFMPTPAARRRFPDITHVDVQKMPFESGTFDFAFSGEVFEHLPDLDACLAEMARVLAPGGRMVATFPFDHDASESLVRARLNADGTIRHLLQPIYHDDPLDPNGALVFTVPGWDILARCRRAGFADAAMTLHISSKYGVTADKLPGVILLTAWKQARPQRSAVKITDPARCRHVVGIVGLPRSGTTVLTALLAAHSKVSAVYEPWNGKVEAFVQSNADFSEIAPKLPADLESAHCLLIKETTTKIVYLRNLLALLDSAPPSRQQDLIVIGRNPLHIFLSEVQGRRDWWGEDNLTISQKVFDDWSLRTLRSLHEMTSAALERNAWIVRYESLTHEPTIVSRMLQSWALEFEPNQLEFHTSLNRREVRGDQSIVKVPRAISSSSETRREEEFRKIEPIVSGSPFLERLTVIGAILHSLPPLARAADCRVAVSEIVRLTAAKSVAQLAG